MQTDSLTQITDPCLFPLLKFSSQGICLLTNRRRKILRNGFYELHSSKGHNSTQYSWHWHWHCFELSFFFRGVNPSILLTWKEVPLF